MGADPFTLIASGFTFFDVSFIAMASIVAALVMRRWSQITGAALIAYGVDVLLRFGLEYASAGDMPANFALQLAFTRMDMNGLAATIRPFLYFGTIAFLFGLKRRYTA
ncbi:hypothetical protein F1654_10025 [Alkalicaulis satelles]|uniref:Uncharacterized protein n=1 Tax=Alkalicaulis satelles TaxID=2609175 RepID=A0A5M6ZD93_9PROT|nr:hypothetical protein [Alkalicaulis satelles]KAA5802170.1 hypothetical protein F1654_10025 [Alkalicaulis satelles]